MRQFEDSKRSNQSERKNNRGVYEDPNNSEPGRGRSGAMKQKLVEPVKNRFAANKNTAASQKNQEAISQKK
tara:strand:+ start:570 stop:782 length:213 start_codon:yes stop_codon:yes gene_type:complete